MQCMTQNKGKRTGEWSSETDQPQTEMSHIYQRQVEFFVLVKGSLTHVTYILCLMSNTIIFLLFDKKKKSPNAVCNRYGWDVEKKS